MVTLVKSFPEIYCQHIFQSFVCLQVEVLVNTVSRDLDLSKNPCAKALGDAAGPGLQQECKGKGQLSIGEMVVTDGYNLWCKNVFHVAAGHWENGKGEAVCSSVLRLIRAHHFAFV